MESEPRTPSLVVLVGPQGSEKLVRLGRVAGARLVAYWFSTDLSTCLARNAARAGRALVPPGILVQTHARTVRPTRAEGFDEVYHVRLGSGGYEILPEVTGALAAR